MYEWTGILQLLQTEFREKLELAKQERAGTSSGQVETLAEVPLPTTVTRDIR